MPPNPEYNEDAPPAKIGTLLVNEGLVREADVDAALTIQQEEINQASLPLGRFLVKKGLITPEQLQRLLSHPELRDGIGTFAVENGFMDASHLAAFIRGKGAGMPLLEALLTRGHITRAQAKAFLRQQMDSMKLGELALRMDMIPEADLKAAVDAKRHPRTIGNILCDLNLITPIDLSSVLTKHQKHLKLGQILLNQGAIDAHTLNRAMADQENRAEPLGAILGQAGMLSEETLYRALAHQHNLPFETYEAYAPTAEEQAALSTIIRKDFARQFRILPVSIDENRLTVAIPDPDNLKGVHFLRAKQMDLRIECALVTMDTFARLFEHLYENRPPAPRPAASTPAGGPEPLQSDPTAPPDMPAVSPNAAEMIGFILKQAIRSGAESIHMDRTASRTTLQYRIQGKLTCTPPPWFEKRFRQIADAVICRFKEMAGLPTGHSLRPAEGRIQTACDDPENGISIPVSLALTTCPTLAGENITVFLRNSGQLPTPPPVPSISRPVRESVDRLLDQSTGLLLVTGPPGSASQAFVHDALVRINHPEVKIITVENPIRYRLPDVIQTQANDADGLSQDILFRMARKLDPDVIMIDALTNSVLARQACETALTGKRLLSTILADDAIHGLTRLRAMGVHPHLLADSLAGIVALQPVNKLCDNCKVPVKPLPPEWGMLLSAQPGQLTLYTRKGGDIRFRLRLLDTSNLTLYTSEGCKACHFTGYAGQVMLSEVLPMTSAIRDAVSQGRCETELRALAMEQGLGTLIHDALAQSARINLKDFLDHMPASARDAFTHTHGAAPVSQPASTHTLIISDPSADRAAIKQLHRVYEQMATGHSASLRPAQPALFERFIRDQFHRICKQYGCRQVSISIGNHRGQVTLTAMPVHTLE